LVGVGGKRGQTEVRNLQNDQKPGKIVVPDQGGAVLKRAKNKNQNLIVEEGGFDDGAETRKLVEDCILADNCKLLRVPLLKAYMEFHKVSTSGRNKADCINAVRNVMKRNGKF
jgi:hypothetical protein